HVRVDIFYSRLSTRGKALVDTAGILLLRFPVCLFILWTSWDYVAVSWRIREGSAETSGLPYVYLLKTTILLLGGFLLWQGVAELIKAMRLMLDGPPG
ncbi:MAG TPA: TRAP transporter small permease subunit, partial [Burkholderiaceae bacterium]|nr:TRAP transporter small permease subunit [Burkholderiaceae bacterium]